MKMTTILRPDYQPDRSTRKPPKITDYISVPVLSTRGVWPAVALIPPEQLARVAVFANQLERGY